jgi:hypothetical protein
MSRIFGPLRQLGYVVHDIDKAMRYWTDVAGVGPFFFLENQPLADFHYRGQPSGPQFSVALAQSGAVQIELVQQQNDERSAFKEFTDQGLEGLQHVAYWTTEFDQHLERARERGLVEVQSGRSGSGGQDERFVYLEPASGSNRLIELSEVSGRKGDLFRAVAAAAEDWTGEEPIRDMSEMLRP